MDAQLRRSYEFFRREAGYVVGQRAMGALRLAKAERDLFGLYGWFWAIESDEDPDLSWMDEKERKREHECVGIFLVDPDGNSRYEHALWGIVDPASAYLRVCAAELALEVSH